MKKDVVDQILETWDISRDEFFRRMAAAGLTKTIRAFSFVPAPYQGRVKCLSKNGEYPAKSNYIYQPKNRFYLPLKSS